MLLAAQDDPRILPSPPARVFIAKLGEDAIELELVAVLASVETMAAVKSDMQLRILKIFAEKGIRIAKQVPAAPAPVVVNLEEVDRRSGAGPRTARDERGPRSATRSVVRAPRSSSESHTASKNALAGQDLGWIGRPSSPPCHEFAVVLLQTEPSMTPCSRILAAPYGSPRSPAAPRPPPRG